LSFHPEKSLGRRIQALRRRQGMTLQKVAEQTRLSKGLLSKIENGTGSSPISTLFHIARALNVKITQFFDDREESQPFVLVKREERLKYGEAVPSPVYQYEALAYKRLEKRMYPFILTTDRKSAGKVSFSHPGEEILFVLNGKMKFRYGKKEWIIRKGDCIYFDATVPHVGTSADGKALKVLMIGCPGENQEMGKRGLTLAL